MKNENGNPGRIQRDFFFNWSIFDIQYCVSYRGKSEIFDYQAQDSELI